MTRSLQSNFKEFKKLFILNETASFRQMIHQILREFTTNYFSAMIEFHQGSSIVTLWSQNSEMIPNVEDFLFYAGNVQTIGKIGDKSIPPMIIQSSFNGIPYFSITSQIFDIEARGFLRVVTLVVANKTVSPIINQSVIDIMNQFQQISFERFLQELPGYYLAIEHFCHELNDKDTRKPVLHGILNEVAPILQLYSIDIQSFSRDLNVTVEKIILVNNKLRNVTELIQWDKHFDSFIEAVYSLPTLPNFDISSINFEITFGLFPSKLFEYVTNQSSQTKKFCDSIQTICRNNIFGHLLFTLFSGHQLIIVSQTIELLVELTEILIHFIPFFSSSQLHYIDQYNESSLAKIIICKELSTEPPPGTSILNLEDKTYEGFICGPNSFVWQIVKSAELQKFAVFLSISYNELKKISDHFVEVIQVFAKSEFQNNHHYISFLQSNNFHIDDLPILSYWVTLIPAFRNLSSIILPINTETFGFLSFES